MSGQRKHPHLSLGNWLKITNGLEPLLSPDSLKSLRAVLKTNAEKLVALGDQHLALVSSTTLWRQRVSRSYYAAFSYSRAARLWFEGSFTTDADDHKRVGELPKTFPNAAKYSNKLSLFREARNIADYDHYVDESDLSEPTEVWVSLAQELKKDCHTFLATHNPYEKKDPSVL